jgi:hypothetical protein
MGLKNYLVEFLKSENCLLNFEDPQQVQFIKMCQLLLAKIAKLTWLDQPEIKDALVPSLLPSLGSGNPRLLLVGLLSINQLVEEMSYMTKMKNQSINRRISISFRDSALYLIFEQTLNVATQLVASIDVL